MAIEYLGLSEINGPLVVLEDVKDAFFEEIVEFTVEGNQHFRFFIQIKDDFHHLKLFFHRDTRIVLVEGILLQESQADDTGNFQNQFLIIGQYVTSDQFYDFHQGTFTVQDCH